MPVEKYLLDANVIIRFLAADHSEHLEKAKQLVSKAEIGKIELVIMPWIVAEVVYVLSSVYGVDRKVLAEVLEVFLGGVGITTEDYDVVIDALHRFAKTKVDYADALLAAYSVARQLSPASFDRDLDKFKDVHRLNP